MQLYQSQDYLKFSSDKEIQNILFSERILFSDKVQKRNVYGFFQERNFLITNKGIYNLKKKELKRRISLDILLGVTISSSSDEFIIHGFECEYDYHFKSQRRKEIIDIMAQTYRKNTGLVLKFVMYENKNLKHYVTQKKEKNNNPEFSRMDLKSLSSVNLYLYGVDKNYDEILEKGIENMYRTDKGNAKIINAKEIKIELLRKTKYIGEIGNGNIFITEFTPTKEYYILKEYSKRNLIQKGIKQLKEIQLTQRNEYTFLNKVLRVFQTEDKLYSISPYLGAFALSEHIRKLRLLDEDKAKFYCGQIALALQYLHSKGIVHRNLNPKNVWVDIDGYIKIIDFSYCIELKGKEQAFKFSYKDEYCAPEIISKEGHDFRADWWSFGIILYEMLCGSTPFLIDDNEETYNQICKGNIHFTSKVKISPYAIDIIEKLLCKDREQRLGSQKGIEEIKSHPFFANVNFDHLLQRTATVPYFTIPVDVLEKDPDDDQTDLSLSTIEEDKKSTNSNSNERTSNIDISKNNQSWFNSLIDECNNNNNLDNE